MREEKVLHGRVIKSHSAKETQKDEREKILRQYLRVIHRQFTPAPRYGLSDLIREKGRYDKTESVFLHVCIRDRKKELMVPTCQDTEQTFVAVQFKSHIHLSDPP